MRVGYTRGWMSDRKSGARRVPLLTLLGLIIAAVLWPGQAAAYVTMSLSANPSSAYAGQSVTITATLTDSHGAAVTGNVAFHDISGPWTGPTCDSQPVKQVGSAYEATCTTSFGQAGDNQIDAQYNGPNGFYALYIDYQVNPVPTTTALSTDAPSPITGNSFTLTATITPSQGQSNPMVGSVQFTDNGAVIQTCRNELNGNVYVGEVNGKPPFVAMCDVTYSQPGSHTYTAWFHKDSHYADSRSAPLTLQVHAGGGGSLAPCPGQDQPFSAAGLAAARNAVICLINEVRANYGMNPLHETSALDSAAQAHPVVGVEQRVGMFFPAVVADQLGDTTPYAAVASMMSDQSGCFSILNQRDQIGVGVVPYAVLPRPLPNQIVWGAAPTWTVEMIATAAGGPINISAQEHCPHPLAPDAAGQRAAPLFVVPGSSPAMRLAFGLDLYGWQPARGGLELYLLGLSAQPVTATVKVTLSSGGRVTTRTVRVRGLRRRHLLGRLLRVPHRSFRHGGVISLSVAERAPQQQSYVFKGGL